MTILINPARKKSIENGDMFYEGNHCKKGHTKRYVKGWGCVECLIQQSKDRVRRGLRIEDTKKYYKENKEEVKETQKKYLNSPLGKGTRSRNWKKRYYGDKLFRIKKLLSKQVYRWCKGIGSSKIRKTEELLGYTAEELKEHIESLFKDGMTWENQGKWHIDHRIPQSYFTTIDQMRECFALDNLKPEWAEFNWSKNNRFIG